MPIRPWIPTQRRLVETEGDVAGDLVRAHCHGACEAPVASFMKLPPKPCTSMGRDRGVAVVQFIDEREAAVGVGVAPGCER